jgi:putative transport protein
VLDLLAQNPLLLLFTIIGLGYLFGNISIFGLKLGVAALLFVGMFFGALDHRLRLPEHIYIIGMVLFVYAIGLQSGHGFFASFKKRGLRFSVIAFLILAGGAAGALFLRKAIGLSAPAVAGLFCGALTSTPAMAAAVETAKSLSSNLPPDAGKLFESIPVVTYGLTYPFGVFGVILAFFISNRIFKADSNKAASGDDDDSIKEVLSRTFIVTNPAVIGKTVEEVLQSLKDSGFILSRIKKGDKTDIVASQTVLELNDQVVAV